MATPPEYIVYENEILLNNSHSVHHARMHVSECEHKIFISKNTHTRWYESYDVRHRMPHILCMGLSVHTTATRNRVHRTLTAPSDCSNLTRVHTHRVAHLRAHSLFRPNGWARFRAEEIECAGMSVNRFASETAFIPLHGESDEGGEPHRRLTMRTLRSDQMKQLNATQETWFWTSEWSSRWGKLYWTLSARRTLDTTSEKKKSGKFSDLENFFPENFPTGTLCLSDRLPNKIFGRKNCRKSLFISELA